MPLKHPRLVDILRKAYSAERAAALAYIGHASSVTDPDEKVAIHEIEQDEWNHRVQVLKIMDEHEVAVSKYYELKFFWIGKFISFSCHIIGWFMPFYFAGRLESGNVCEYFRMMHYFDELGISKHHMVLYEMGIKEKEHEEYFREALQTHRLLPLFERFFGWGENQSFNDVDLVHKYSVERSTTYCRGDRSVDEE